MKTYILEHDGKICLPRCNCNQRGFSLIELESIQKNEEYKDWNIICIEDEVKKYHLTDSKSNSWGLSEEVFQYKLWYEAYLNDNLNGFSLPIKVKNNTEYRKKVEEKLLEYMEYLNRPAFAYRKETLAFIANECKLILKALDNLIEGKKETAEKVIQEIIEIISEDTFFVSDLENCYSFRGIAPFVDLRSEEHDKVYDKMLNENLTFFRVRTKNQGQGAAIKDVENILHLPYALKDKASSMRFSSKGTPSLYLGTTTYGCSKECNWNGKDEMYASVFVPNADGQRLKILNLTISEALINGIYNRCGQGYNRTRYELQNKMLKIFPLVITTSFSVECEEKIKYQYLISQELMEIALQNGIDGIAYLSMKGKNEFQYPQGVNLAIPATDISETKQYSEKCSCFDVLRPILYCNQKEEEKKSYINKIYVKSFLAKVDIDGESKFYGDTEFGKFDNYLVEIFEYKNV